MIRPPAVAGTFYPAEPDRLRALVASLLEEADRLYPAPASEEAPAGATSVAILAPHAGLAYSGVVAAAAWRALLGVRIGTTVDEPPVDEPPTVVVLGTNHQAGWLEGIGIWDRGSWRTPLGDVVVDAELAAEIGSLDPSFSVDRDAHAGEHSIEVQLPFIQRLAPGARVVPLAVATGVGRSAIDAGERLGALLAARWRAGRRVLLAISTDMAHYPSHAVAVEITDELAPLISAIQPEALAARERELRGAGVPGLACGLCGIEPAVVGLAALRAAGVASGTVVASATSADAGGPADRVVGYLGVAFARGGG